MQQLCRKLLTSAKDDEADTVRDLVETFKVDPNFQNPMGQSAMHIAAIWGATKAAEALLELGANINIRNNPMLGCQTPLMLAVRRERYAFAIFLKDKGANLKLLDTRGKAAWESCKDVTVAGLIGAPRMDLIVAAQDGDLDKIKRLVASGDIDLELKNADGDTALQICSDRKKMDCVKFLLEAKASPDCSDASGTGPLHIAAKTDNLPLAKMLVEAGADLDLVDSSKEECFQGNFVLKKADGSAEALEALDKTALVVAVEEENDDVAMFLILSKADVNIPDAEGMNALHHAMENENLEVMELLLKHDANAEVGNGIIGTDNTCLGQAVASGEREQAQLLLKYKANVNAVCKGGMCPIHLAARRGDQALVQMCMDAGADATGPDKSGRTALDLARANKRIKLVPFLEQVVDEMTNW